MKAEEEDRLQREAAEDPERVDRIGAALTARLPSWQTVACRVCSGFHEPGTACPGPADW